MKLDVKAFSLACGVTWGLGMFILTWWIMYFDYSTFDFTFIGELYRGYSISPKGSVIGLLWGFADGAIGGFVLASLYNLFIKKEK